MPKFSSDSDSDSESETPKEAKARERAEQRKRKEAEKEDARREREELKARKKHKKEAEKQRAKDLKHAEKEKVRQDSGKYAQEEIEVVMGGELAASESGSVMRTVLEEGDQENSYHVVLNGPSGGIGGSPAARFIRWRRREGVRTCTTPGSRSQAESTDLEWCIVWWEGWKFVELVQQGEAVLREQIEQARAEAQRAIYCRPEPNSPLNNGGGAGGAVRLVFLLEGAEECVTQQLQERYTQYSQPSATPAVAAGDGNHNPPSHALNVCLLSPRRC
jgi:hypothetical protein